MDTTQNWDSQSYPLRIKARKCNSLRKKNTDWLVVSTPLEKNICQLSVGIIIPNIWKNKTCSKPPTS